MAPAFVWICAAAFVALLGTTLASGHAGSCRGPFEVDHSHRGNEVRRQIDQLSLTPRDAVECFSLFAEGTQNYECPFGNGTWVLTNPNAVLFAKRPRHCNAASHNVAFTHKDFAVSHFFLSTPDDKGGVASWESNQDGSRITTAGAAAPVAAKVDSPDGPQNIPWLSTVKTSGAWGPLFGNTVAVVRADTRGGVAPDAKLCNRVGKVTFVPYTATYVFYAAS